MTQKNCFEAEGRAARPVRARRASDRGSEQATNPSAAAEEQLILVDERNRATGCAGKTVVHRAGLLHRAFSIFIVDHRGRIVVQQRSANKYHSAGLWANSCCGHPRPGERTVSAARRRLDEELGLTSALSFGFYARYQADLGNGMHENEFVYVYFGRLRSDPKPDPAEIADIAHLSVDDIGRRIRREPNAFTFWFRHYFRNHRAEIARLAKRASLLPPT
jgi:isopentenyl-diphosphate Delta-isomerase